MKTIFSIVLLMIWSAVADYLAVFILNIVGVLGALIAGSPQKSSKVKYLFGIIISTLGQSYVYLAYVAFIVNWTLLARSIQKVNIIVWPVAFLAAIIPICFGWARARREADADGYTNAQISALALTVLFSFIAFFVFILNIQIMQFVYWWVPYMKP